MNDKEYRVFSFASYVGMLIGFFISAVIEYSIYRGMFLFVMWAIFTVIGIIKVVVHK